jgi:hypothetical protein
MNIRQNINNSYISFMINLSHGRPVYLLSNHVLFKYQIFITSFVYKIFLYQPLILKTLLK